ncbi:MAG: aminotransferase class V-fold PLP-dependent enzyme [Bacteroidota bacterium]|nr:MAG: aminotransferase class V-fold PLP-dependent enzyme [Bacteroidota bacterium]
MKAKKSLTYREQVNTHLKLMEKSETKPEISQNAIDEFRYVIRSVLETYSNVHRGSGYHSMVTTRLFDKAREIVLASLGLKSKNHVVIFCTRLGAEMLKSQLSPANYRSLSAAEYGLPIGVYALAVERKALSTKITFQTGGGTARLVAPKWVIWAKTPDKFEAGTPAIVNIIAFAHALQLTRKYGNDIFRTFTVPQSTVKEILYHDSLKPFSGKELLAELNKALIGHNSIVPTTKGDKQFINFDNAASTPTFTPILEAVFQACVQPRQVQQEIIQEVKLICSVALNFNLKNYDVLFTSNTTEAINLVAESFKHQLSDDTEPLVLNTLLEHNSNELPWRAVQGLSILRLKIDANGFIDLNELESLLKAYNLNNEFGKKRIKLVAVSGASNVLGVCNDLKKISEIVHRYHALLLVDAAQLVAHRKIDLEECGIDYLAFSAHKMYAPFGSGALIARKGLLNFETDRLKQIQLSGEENVVGIAAMGKAFVLLQRIGMDLICNHEQQLLAYALEKITQIPGITIYGLSDTYAADFHRKGGVIVFSLKGVMPFKVAKQLALQGGIGVRSGCHCSHILIKHLLKIPAKLERFQGLIVSIIPKLELPGVVRISLGMQNTKVEIDTLIQTLKEIAGKASKHDKRSSSQISPEQVKQKLKLKIERKTEEVYN